MHPKAAVLPEYFFFFFALTKYPRWKEFIFQSGFAEEEGTTGWHNSKSASRTSNGENQFKNMMEVFHLCYSYEWIWAPQRSDVSICCYFSSLQWSRSFSGRWSHKLHAHQDLSVKSVSIALSHIFYVYRCADFSISTNFHAIFPIFFF